jgi:hypothetical protein
VQLRADAYVAVVLDIVLSVFSWLAASCSSVPVPGQDGTYRASDICVGAVLCDCCWTRRREGCGQDGQAPALQGLQLPPCHPPVHVSAAADALSAAGSWRSLHASLCMSAAGLCAS